MKMKKIKKILVLMFFLLFLFLITGCSSINLPENLIHTISASCGSEGSISPSGKVSVLDGFDQSFIITPDPGYQIKDIRVDGISGKVINPYTFTDVTQDHTIYVTFSGYPVPGAVHNLTQDTYYETIQAALDDANNNNTIEVYYGIYDENVTFPNDKKIILQSVYGASSTTIRGIADFPTVCIEDCLIGTALNGFTVTHQSGNSGSGIKINRGFITIDHCIISGNSSDDYGGGIYNDEGSLTITGSTVSGNTATCDGGGIFNGTSSISGTSSSLTITDSAIFDNSADRYGGGIHNFSSTLIITGSNIYNNSALSNGGGIMIWATGWDSLSIGGSNPSDKNFICGNYKSGNNPSLDQQIRAYFLESLYDYFCDTNNISINCGLLHPVG